MFERFVKDDRDGDRRPLPQGHAAFTYNGPGRLPGIHVGHNVTQRFWAAQDRLWGGFVPEFMDLGESDRSAFLLLRSSDRCSGVYTLRAPVLRALSESGVIIVPIRPATNT